MPKYNPRYVAYARAYRLSPESMMIYDEKNYPGVCMTGFILWIIKKWAEYKKIHNINGFEPAEYSRPNAQKEFDIMIGA